MNDCRPWTQKSAPGILYGQAEDVRSMLLFATGFKRPRTDKKHKAAALRCLWRIIVKGQWQKFRHAAYGRTAGRWAYGRAYGRTGIWPRGRQVYGGGRRRVSGRRRVYGRRAGARAASVRRRAYGRATRAPTASRAYASGACSPAGRSFLPPSSRLVKFSGLMGRA